MKPLYLRTRQRDDFDRVPREVRRFEVDLWLIAALAFVIAAFALAVFLLITKGQP